MGFHQRQRQQQQEPQRKGIVGGNISAGKKISEFRIRLGIDGSAVSSLCFLSRPTLPLVSMRVRCAVLCCCFLLAGIEALPYSFIDIGYRRAN